MKVDILTPIRFGGPQKWGDDLVRALKEQGIEARNIHNFWGIIQRFFYTDADVIHSTLPLFFTFHNKPLILTIHGIYPKENLWKYIYPRTIRKAKAVTVPSEFLKNELKLEKAKVIPNGIFLEDFKPVKHEKREVIRIVTVTGFKFWEKARGVLELLKILEQVKKLSKQKFVFIVVGGGPFLEKIKEESKKYDVPVEFIGFHPNPKEILQQSDIFVYYSFLDNMPISIIEAIACNLPIVSNDIGAIGELVDVYGNNYDYINEILKVIKTKKHLKNNIENYNWNNISKKLIEVYQ